MLPRIVLVFFFLMIRRPPRSTLDRSSAASDVYKRQALLELRDERRLVQEGYELLDEKRVMLATEILRNPVSYTHLRAHETVLDLVCRLLPAKKKNTKKNKKDKQASARTLTALYVSS